MSEITIKKIKDEVLRLAEEKPDFVYPKVVRASELGYSAVYNANDEQPGCIFGQALDNLGAPVLPSFEGESIRTVLNQQFPELFPAGGAYINNDVHNFVIVQNNQDQQMPWGEAVASLREDNA